MPLSPAFCQLDPTLLRPPARQATHGPERRIGGTLRARFVAHCPRVHVSVLHEVMPEVREPPASFVQLSAAYEPETAAARERGWPTIVLDLHHLALLTDPEPIADALLYE